MLSCRKNFVGEGREGGGETIGGLPSNLETSRENSGMEPCYRVIFEIGFGGRGFVCTLVADAICRIREK